MSSEIKQPNLYNEKSKVIFHICFWLLIGFIYYFNYERIVRPYVLEFVLKDLFTIISLFYISGYYIFPKYLLKGKIWILIPWLFFCYIWYASTTYIFCLILNNHLPDVPENTRLLKYFGFMLHGGYFELFNRKIPILIYDFSFLMMLPFGIKITKDLMTKNAEKEKLENEMVKMERNLLRAEKDRLEMEINFLKAQINPHFISNSLNTINALVQNEHPYASEAIGMLGDILNYTLYIASNASIPLKNEVDIIQQYLKMQNFRYDANVEINIPDIPDGIMIMPHLLLMLVENGYKHGIEKLRSGAFIKIELTISESNKIVFNVKNNFPPAEQAQPSRVGIGLNNVVSRLKVFYPEKFQLEKEVKDDLFSIRLTIQL